MTTLPEMIILPWCIFLIHGFAISIYVCIWLYCQRIWWQNKKGRGNMDSEQLKHLSTKIQEVASNVTITVNNEKLCLTTRIPVTQVTFWNKVTPDVDGFNDGPVFQCHVQVVENTFVDDPKKNYINDK